MTCYMLRCVRNRPVVFVVVVVLIIIYAHQGHQHKDAGLKIKLSKTTTTTVLLGVKRSAMDGRWNKNMVSLVSSINQSMHFVPDSRSI